MRTFIFILIILVAFLSSNIFSQNTSPELVNEASLAHEAWGLVVTNNSYVPLVEYQTYGTNNENIMNLLSLNQDLDSNWDLTMNYNGNTSIYSAVCKSSSQLNPNGVMLARKDSVYAISASGNIVKKSYIPIDTAITWIDLKIYYHNQEYFISQREYSADGDNNEVFVYDQNLNFSRIMLVKGSVYDISFDESYMYVASFTMTGGVNTNVSSRLSKYEIASGQEIWSKFYPDFGTPKVCINNGFIYYSYISNVPQFPGAMLSLKKLDLNGNEIWTTSWDSGFLNPTNWVGIYNSDIVPLPNRGCLIAGQSTHIQDMNDQNYDTNWYDGVILAYSADGELLWVHRSIAGSIANHGFGSIVRCLTWDQDNYLIATREDSPGNKVLNYFISKFRLDGITAVKEEGNILPYSLSQNYPNPFNPSTSIDFSVPQRGLVTLKVYDLLGREVATLVDEELQAGNYKQNFDASKLASGVYIYRITIGRKFSASKKMTLIK